MRAREAVESLIGALSDRSRYVRAAAARALGLIADPRAVDALVNVLADEAWLYGDARLIEQTWEVAAEALGRIGTPDTYATLIRKAREPDLGLQIPAIRALAKTVCEESVRQILAQAADCQWALEVIGDFCRQQGVTVFADGRIERLASLHLDEALCPPQA